MIGIVGGLFNGTEWENKSRDNIIFTPMYKIDEQWLKTKNIILLYSYSARQLYSNPNLKTILNKKAVILLNYYNGPKFLPDLMIKYIKKHKNITKLAKIVCNILGSSNYDILYKDALEFIKNVNVLNDSKVPILNKIETKKHILQENDINYIIEQIKELKNK